MKKIARKKSTSTKIYLHRTLSTPTVLSFLRFNIHRYLAYPVMRTMTSYKYTSRQIHIQTDTHIQPLAQFIILVHLIRFFRKDHLHVTIRCCKSKHSNPFASQLLHTQSPHTEQRKYQIFQCCPNIVIPTPFHTGTGRSLRTTTNRPMLIHLSIIASYRLLSSGTMTPSHLRFITLVYPNNAFGWRVIRNTRTLSAEVFSSHLDTKHSLPSNVRIVATHA